jgi:hypothetical protein
LLNAPPRDTIMIAIAKEPESIIDKIASEYNENELLKYSIVHADITAIITATHKGLYQATKPTATPTKDA